MIIVIHDPKSLIQLYMFDTDLEETKKQYYKSLEDAKLPSLQPLQPCKPYPKRYSSKKLKHWVESVDIYSLEDEAVNFAVADTIVTGFRDYRNRVGRELSRQFKYEDVNLPAELNNIGSCWDGSKVGNMNEVDSLYIMSDGPFIIKPHSKPGFYNVFIKRGLRKLQMKPRKLRDEFADHYSQLILQMKLPDYLRHGGYNSSRKEGRGHRSAQSVYSGIRYNGPATTSQFLGPNKSLLTWDVTPCIEFNESKIQTQVRQFIHPILDQNPRKQFPQIPFHLIPDPLENLWRLSTAHFEAELLRYLSDESPVKKALMVCKILCTLLKRWNQENETSMPSTNQGKTIDVVKELIRQLANNQQQKKALERWMRFAHIWLLSDIKAEYNEDVKSNISINTAAVKHIIIKAGLRKNAGLAFAATNNEALVVKLVRVVSETLSSDQHFASDHAFLPETRISHFSLLASNASDKVDLARRLCEQCCILLSGAMTEVGINLVLWRCHFRRKITPPACL